VPFKVAPGIRMMRIDRASGRRVFSGWPTDDPKSAIIWEAFKPENEPKRPSRKEQQKIDEALAKPRTAADTDFLQRQGGIY